jgi:4'-phosphopantetheinyl transferase EntD
LLAGESARVEKAAEKRRREYRAGRHVARLVLADLGLPAAPLLADEDGVPSFPQGVAGSLSHTGRELTYAAAIASREVKHLALDVEILQTVDVGVAERIASAAEARVWKDLLGADHWAIVCFSCKEAAYKCIFPILRKVLEFHDVELLPASPGEVIATIESQPRVPPVSVRYGVQEGRVTSIAYLPGTWR